MDNVTHTMVGAAIGEAGLKRLSGLSMATLMIAANIPDLDALIIPFGDQLPFRRGITHGPLGVLVLPAVLTAAMVSFDRWQSGRGRRPEARLPVRPWQLLALAYLGALTHPFLDWLNNYGIRFLMPFSHEWYYGDALFIIDPWIWLALGGAIFIARRRARLGRGRERRPAIIALAAVALYIGLMIGGSRVASHAATEAIVERGLGPVERLMASPLPAHPLRREIIFDRGDSYGIATFNLGPAPSLIITQEFLPTNLDDPIVQRALADPHMANFMYWSRFPFFEVEEREDGTWVHAGDLRYLRRPGTGWAGRSVEVP